MGRSTQTSQAALVSDVALAEDITQNSQALAEHQQDIMARFGEGLPYERERIVHEARFYMAQSAEAMLEAGKRLIIIKENEPHGEFTNIVTTRLGLNERTAQLMMKASLKYLSPTLEGKTKSISVLGKTKLFELMTEDDEDLAELAEGGTIAGLTLDEVDRMSVRELRAKLRETETALEASRRLASEKDRKINELSETRLIDRKRPPSEDSLRRLREEISGIGFDVKATLMGSFREGMEALRQHSDDITLHGDFLAGLLNDVEAEIRILRTDFNLPLEAPLNPVPDWAKDEGGDDDDLVIPDHVQSLSYSDEEGQQS
jgi:hypothetical protein